MAPRQVGGGQAGPRRDIALPNAAAAILSPGAAPDLAPGTATEEVQEFRDGLIRNQVRQGLYYAGSGRISVLSDRLFRTRVSFPANVVTGIYNVSVYYIRDGSPVHAQATPLRVSKIGLGAYVFRFAHYNAAAYGVLAVLVAALAGWLAAAIFRKV